MTEFLPVSSDGHLLLIRRLFRWSDEGLAFDAALHLGTFSAALVFFRATWRRLLTALLGGQGAREDRALLWMIALATVPGAVAGYASEASLSGRFRGLEIAGVGFLVSAVLLFLADRWASLPKSLLPEKPVTVSRALFIGILQVFALLPGLSRSGATIAGGMLAGLSRERAVEFSFLLALPIVGGAGLHGLIQWLGNGASPFGPLLLGILFAFGTGVWSIGFFLNYVRRHSLTPFVVYLLGVAVLALFLSR